jgi:hypothetical protein
MDFIKVVFLDVRNADYELSVPFAYLEHHLNEFGVVFFDVRDGENAWHFDTLKQRFIDFTKVVLLDVQIADYKFSGPLAYLHII